MFVSNPVGFVRAGVNGAVTDAEKALRHAADVLEEFDGEAGSAVPAPVYSALVTVARRRLAGVRSASVATWDGRRFSTAAYTDEAAIRADKLQYDSGTGPCVAAIAGAALSHEPDFRSTDDLAALGFRGALSLRLTATGPGRNAVALNLYSDGPHGFDGPTIALATLLALHARTSLAAADGDARALHLERSRETSQQIGAAVGVLMAKRGLGHDEAMGVLRTASQRSNTRVSELAAQVIATGELPIRNNRGPRK